MSRVEDDPAYVAMRAKGMQRVLGLVMEEVLELRRVAEAAVLRLEHEARDLPSGPALHEEAGRIWTARQFEQPVDLFA